MMSVFFILLPLNLGGSSVLVLLDVLHYHQEGIVLTGHGLLVLAGSR